MSLKKIWKNPIEKILKTPNENQYFSKSDITSSLVLKSRSFTFKASRRQTIRAETLLSDWKSCWTKFKVFKNVQFPTVPGQFYCSQTWGSHVRMKCSLYSQISRKQSNLFELYWTKTKNTSILSIHLYSTLKLANREVTGAWIRIR